MAMFKSIKLSDHSSELTDPRRREPVYPLVNFVTMAVCAVICDADDFVAIARFANTKGEWFVDTGADYVLAVKGSQPTLRQGIENNLHWQLAVTFQEDKCRIRMGQAAGKLHPVTSTDASRCEPRVTGGRLSWRIMSRPVILGGLITPVG